MKLVALVFAVMVLSGCVAMPHDNPDGSKRLETVNVATESHSYHSWTGYVLTPIIYPVSFLASGAYVVVHNTLASISADEQVSEAEQQPDHSRP